MKTTLAISAVVAGFAGIGLLAAGAASAKPWHGGGHHMFDEADANEDGEITKEELAAHRAALFEEMDADGDGAVTPAEIEAHHEAKRAERRAKHFERMDADGDGAISEAEFAAIPTPMFDKLDANEDGVLTKDEAKAAHKKKWREKKPE